MSSIVAGLLTGAAMGQALPAHPTLGENLSFQLVGLTIVLGALYVLYLLCAGVGLLFQRLETRQITRGHATATTMAGNEPAIATAPHDDVPIAVIAAAVAAAVERPHRLLEVRPQPQAWSLEGRRLITTSHQLPRKV